MATWMKAEKAAEYAGGISTKVLYAAVRDGRCLAAKIGAGRNLIWCEKYIDDWLQASVKPVDRKDTSR